MGCMGAESLTGHSWHQSGPLDSSTIDPQWHLLSPHQGGEVFTEYYSDYSLFVHYQDGNLFAECEQIIANFSNWLLMIESNCNHKRVLPGDVIKPPHKKNVFWGKKMFSSPCIG